MKNPVTYLSQLLLIEELSKNCNGHIIDVFIRPLSEIGFIQYEELFILDEEEDFYLDKVWFSSLGECIEKLREIREKYNVR